jgi:spore coat-associated protein N
VARIAFLAKNPKRVLGSLAVLVAATGVVIGSGANFTASSANPSNSFAAGTLSILNSKEGTAVLSSTGSMKPGGPAETGTVDIQNDGDLAGNFELTRSAIVDSDAGNPMSAKLNLTVTDCGEWTAPATPNVCGDADDQVIESGGTISSMGTVDLGNFAADEKHRYEFSVQLDASATDAYQGDTSSVTFDWDAVQS